ncbi:hypothetical protein TH25_01415 [Thalassospira profundimaris]|uniref:Uncharacterized protein n=1 Tax=Thalassospira profundimaris TaxID=502049 RepID=A0A367XK49_9PROT|nr:transporter substrate-binding domain-containing protein [Thalassospira profundimaris]RCK54037.1 hypothetical protein TH25_01415 [Thalassospira profundimaris]
MAALAKQLCFIALLTGLTVAVLYVPVYAETNGPPFGLKHNITIDLQTTEWPPYSSEHLPGQGLASIIVRAAFARENISVHIEFMPWQRSLQNFNTENTPGTGHRPDAIFPIYDNPQRQKGFFLSRTIVRSPVGFVYYHGSAFDWQTLDDLTNLTIGVVRGYSNGSDFDQYVQDGKLHIVETHDDTTLLRLLAAGRVDVVVMDQLVMRHILDTNPDFDQTRRWFYFHPNILENKSLHVGFHHTPEGKALRNAFDRGLSALQCPDNNCPARHVPPTKFPTN